MGGKNLQNLRGPFTPEEARKYGAMGAKASIEARRRKKTFKQAFNAIANTPVTSYKIREVLRKNGIDDENTTNAAAVAFRIVAEAIKGNPRMVSIFLEQMGETAPRRVELTGAGGSPLQVERKNPLEGMSVEEIRKLAGLDE